MARRFLFKALCCGRDGLGVYLQECYRAPCRLRNGIERQPGFPGDYSLSFEKDTRDLFHWTRQLLGIKSKNRPLT